jgi:hypothetical protein
VWFLSSLLQQSYLPDVTVNLAYVKNNGSPSTESIIDFYRSKGIKFRTIILEDANDLAFRGKIRNAQISLSRSDYLFFYDIDQVLHPDFFKLWKDKLKPDAIYYERQKLTTTGPRIFLAINAQGKRRYIRRAFVKAQTFFPQPASINRVSGGLFMVSRELLYKVTKGIYSDTLYPKDRHFHKQITNSDPVFRKNFKLKSLSLAPVIHLSHSSWSDYKEGRVTQQ